MYKRTNMKIYVPALAVGLQLVFAAAQVGAQETIREQTTTTGTPEVVKSFMVPTMVQTKETTDSAGDTTKTSAPMIMERHEQVVVPQEQTTSETTIEKKPAVVEETIEQQKCSTTAAKKVSYRKPCSAPRHHVAHRTVHHAQHQIAQSTNQISVKRTVVEQPTVVQHTEKTQSNSIIYERKDPALEN
jgi:hypothetical protein